MGLLMLRAQSLEDGVVDGGSVYYCIVEVYTPRIRHGELGGGFLSQL